jgi:hypothetical protein
LANHSGAAELLGAKPTTLEARMKKLGIVRPNSSPGVSYWLITEAEKTMPQIKYWVAHEILEVSPSHTTIWTASA